MFRAKACMLIIWNKLWVKRKEYGGCSLSKSVTVSHLCASLAYIRVHELPEFIWRILKAAIISISQPVYSAKALMEELVFLKDWPCTEQRTPGMFAALPHIHWWTAGRLNHYLHEHHCTQRRPLSLQSMTVYSTGHQVDLSKACPRQVQDLLSLLFLLDPCFWPSVYCYMVCLFPVSYHSCTCVSHMTVHVLK